MKIEGIKTEQVIIEITEKERKQLVVEFLEEKFKLQSSHCDDWLSIDKGNLIDNWEEGGGNHSWFTDKVLRKATKEDKTILGVINKIGDI